MHWTATVRARAEGFSTAKPVLGCSAQAFPADWQRCRLLKTYKLNQYHKAHSNVWRRRRHTVIYKKSATLWLDGSSYSEYKKVLLVRIQCKNFKGVKELLKDTVSQQKLAYFIQTSQKFTVSLKNKSNLIIKCNTNILLFSLCLWLGKSVSNQTNTTPLTF